MDVNTAKALLSQKGYSVKEESRLGNDTGTQLRLQSGQIVNVYDSGSINVQGRNPSEIRTLLESVAGTASASANGGSRKAFVVYGHDESAKAELEAMLRRWNIEPLILDQLPSGGMTIIEKLEQYQDNVAFGVVLATPDDEGHRAGHAAEKAFRARQNVVLELGMLLSRLGRSRVAILIRTPDKMERPSDIQGLIYIPFKDSVSETALPLAKEMNAQSIAIDLGKL
jgi:predicted nucleotide-binding protein